MAAMTENKLFHRKSFGKKETKDLMLNQHEREEKIGFPWFVYFSPK
jgi:hypothetical protein